MSICRPVLTSIHGLPSYEPTYVHIVCKIERAIAAYSRYIVRARVDKLLKLAGWSAPHYQYSFRCSIRDAVQTGEAGG